MNLSSYFNNSRTETVQQGLYEQPIVGQSANSLLDASRTFCTMLPKPYPDPFQTRLHIHSVYISKIPFNIVTCTL
jgi:hypothetical protein